MQLRRNAKIELLRAVPLFSGCTSKELGQISALGDELHQPAGAELITEGVKGREFFVLIDGPVEARRNGRRIAAFETGDFFGEIALLTESPRTATVVAPHSCSPARDLRASRSGGSSPAPPRSRRRRSPRSPSG